MFVLGDLTCRYFLVLVPIIMLTLIWQWQRLNGVEVEVRCERGDSAILAPLLRRR